MIITDLRATNVLKYARLELNNLPAKGLIAISGPNESGKTAVVEAVCFALFGRTYSQNEDESTRIIRWGEEGCRIEMAFEANDGGRYRVSRALDRDGVHAARLYRNDEKEPFASGPSTVRDAIVGICGFDYQQYVDALYLAQMEISVPHPQSETLREIAGTRELETVAAELEREIREHETAVARIERQRTEIEDQIATLGSEEEAVARLNSQEETLRGALEKRRADLEALRELAETLRKLGPEVRGEISELTHLDTETPIAWWRTELESLEAAAGKIAAACETIETDNRLCSERPLQRKTEELRQRLSAVDRALQAIDAYRHRLEATVGQAEAGTEQLPQPPIPERIARIRGRLVGPRLLRFVLGLLFLVAAIAALGLWGLWWLAEPGVSGTLADGAIGFVSALWPEATPAAVRRWILPAATGGTVLTVVAWLWSLALDRGIRRRMATIQELEAQQADLERRIASLSGLEAHPLTRTVETLRAMRDPELEEILTGLEQGPASVFLDSGTLREELAGWERLASEIDVALSDLREAVAARIGSLEQSVEAGKTALERLAAERSALSERRSQVETLREQARELERQLAGHRQAIQVHELALRLTRGTCRSIYQRFNNVLSKFTGEILPRLTEGHYRQIQISDDLKLRVFSVEKNDFAGLEELSSGTQRQILLAVRLAMAKALVDASDQARQFIVLDEPFAFFDRERIHLTLRALPELDRRISQIWIISQEFADYDRFKLNIRCSRDSDELVVGGNGAGGLFSLGRRGETT